MRKEFIKIELFAQSIAIVYRLPSVVCCLGFSTCRVTVKATESAEPTILVKLSWDTTSISHIPTKNCVPSLPMLNFRLLWYPIAKTNIGRAENITTVPTDATRIAVHGWTFCCSACNRMVIGQSECTPHCYNWSKSYDTLPQQRIRIYTDCRRKGSWITDATSKYIFNFFALDRFHSRGQKLYKFLGTIETFYMKRKFNPQRVFPVHQHGHFLIVLYANMAAVTSCENHLLDVTRTSKWICAFSDCPAIIPQRSFCKMLANSSGIEF